MMKNKQILVSKDAPRVIKLFEKHKKVIAGKVSRVATSGKRGAAVRLGHTEGCLGGLQSPVSCLGWSLEGACLTISH